MNPLDATTPDLEVDEYTGQLKRVELQQNSLVYSPLNRNLLYTKAEVDAKIAAGGGGGGGSGSVTNIASADGSVTITNPTTTPDLAVTKAPKLSTIRNIAGVAFDGTADITLASTNLSDSASITLINATQTLTNKRVTKRVLATSANSATPAINTDNCDVFKISGQSVNITSFTTNLTGTPNDGDSLIIHITDAGSPVTLTWGASFESSIISLPSSTVASTMLMIGFIYRTTTSKWRCIAVA